MKMFMYKKFYLFLCLILITIALHGQQQSVGTWKYYMSYYDAFIVAETPNKIFAVYKGAEGVPDDKIDGSLLSYSPDDREVKLYTKADGLNDTGITHLSYNDETGSLVIIYNNSNIDIFTNDGIYNLPFIKDNTYYQDKTVYGLDFVGSDAYVSTGFGIVVLDLKRKEVKTTYSLEMPVRSVCIFGEYIYASASSLGIYRALLTSNLQDKKNWESYFTLNNSLLIFDKLLIFENRLFFYIKGNGIYYFEEQSDYRNLELTQSDYNQITLLNNQLVLLSKNGEISFYSDLQNKITLQDLDAKYISTLKNDNTYWLAEGESGLTSIEREAETSFYKRTMEGITINSPKRNYAFSLTFSHNKLLVSGGGWGADRLNRPGTLMVLENGEWYNFDENKISEQIIQENQNIDMLCRDFIASIVDPLDANHYFVSSWGEGLYEFKDNEFIARYDYTNSPLASAVPDNNPNKHFYTRVNGLAYDKDNNLYILNTGATTPITEYSAANKKWNSYTVEPLQGKSNLGNLLITNNMRWVNISRPSAEVGVYAQDEDGKGIFTKTFTNQDGRSVDANGYFCMAEDLNGSIWVGTDKGPIILSRSSFLNGFTSCINPKVPKNDGTNNADYLLNGQKITAIAIDGGNRKWIGTEGAGLFLVSSTGEEVLEYFTSENSHLVSNIINSIVINGETGEVFIATDKGLVSYMGDAITGKPDYSNVYAFPNPVRPGLEDRVTVTGLIENSIVKITDLLGNLVAQGNSAGGQFTWDCKNQAGRAVQSGIYLVLASTPVGNGLKTESVVTKIMVVR